MKTFLMFKEFSWNSLLRSFYENTNFKNPTKLKKYTSFEQGLRSFQFFHMFIKTETNGRASNFCNFYGNFIKFFVEKFFEKANYNDPTKLKT